MSSTSDQQATRGKGDVGVVRGQAVAVQQPTVQLGSPNTCYQQPNMGTATRRSDASIKNDMFVATVAQGGSLTVPLTPCTLGPAHVGFNSNVDALCTEDQVLFQKFLVFMKSMGKHCALDVVCEPQVAQDDGVLNVQNSIAIGEAVDSSVVSSGQIVNDALAQFVQNDSVSDGMSDVAPSLNFSERQELEFLRARLAQVELSQGDSGAVPVQQGVRSGLETPRVAATVVQQREERSGPMTPRVAGPGPMQLYGGQGTVPPHSSGLGPEQLYEQDSTVRLQPFGSVGEIEQQPFQYVPPICVMSEFGPLRVKDGRIQKFNDSRMWVWLSDIDANKLSGSVLQQLSQVQLLDQSFAAVEESSEPQVQQQLGDLLGIGSDVQQHFLQQNY